MWIAHGHECYNELKWKYCMYIHDDVIAKAIKRFGDVTSFEEVNKIIAEDEELLPIRAKLLKFIIKPPSEEELKNLAFEQKKRDDQEKRVKVDLKSLSSKLRGKLNELKK